MRSERISENKPISPRPPASGPDPATSDTMTLEQKLARRRRKRALLIALSLVYLFGATALGVVLGGFEEASPYANLTFFLLLNLNLLALFWLVYFVGRNLVRLVLERRQGVIGTRFKTRVVGAFLVVIGLPMALLFVVAMGLGANYIDRFFTPEIHKPIEQTIEVAGAIFDYERSQGLEYARLALEGRAVPAGYNVRYLDASPPDAPASIREAFKGTASAEIVTAGEEETLIAAMPVNPNAPHGGIIVIERRIPLSLTSKINEIRKAHDNYLSLEAFSLPLKLNYLMLLGFFSLLIVFATIWFAIRIATWMTEPVKELALATEEVAAGNFSVSVKMPAREDEIGMLVRSFNHMVTEIREGKLSLEHAYTNLDSIVRNIESGVISLDARGRVELVNEAACRIFGVLADDVIGKPYLAVLSKIESEDLASLIKSINLRAFRGIEREAWATVEKRKVLLHVSVSAMKTAGSPNAGIIGFLVVVDDITEVAKAQRALAWQEVARRMAHEIKNPLTPIQLNTERMLKKWQKKDPDFDEVFERSTKSIIAEVQGLKALVNEFSKLGKMPELNRTPTEISAMISGVADLYAPIKGLTVEQLVASNIPPVSLDYEQLRRVLINLFDNALEAMGRKGSIRISAHIEPDGNTLLIEVADSGPGIKDEDKERLFVPYFSTKKDGTGLGLAIAERIIAEHRGTISVSDNLPKGSVFSIRLPIEG